jgi:tripartite-type tricarboxylate transporter receptor subunit TctC
MKKILVLLAMMISSIAYAQKTVHVVWPFAVGSPQANMIRTMIDSANSQQDKYQFVFLHKPGAGGAVAAYTVAESKDLSLLASTSSFYIRPLLYKDSHNVDDFNMVTLVCSAQPLSIFSKKINRLADAHGREVTLGVIPGSITTLVTRTIKRENLDIKVVEVPYKGTPEATTDMLGGHIDGSVDFIGTSVTARFGNDIKILGITGKRQINGHPTFQSLKVNGLENVTNDYFFFVNKSVDVATRMELNSILTNSYTEKTKFFCEDDFGQLVKTPYAQVDSINQSNKQRWEKLTSGFAKE